MPIIHRHQKKDGYFVRTTIQGNIITFQLTDEGVKNLLSSGIEDGDRFRRRLLYKLILSGDAYTHGTGPGKIGPLGKYQMELDFANDPEPETLFPKCSLCRSMEDLHLVEIQDGSKHKTGLYCIQCRKKNPTRIDTSIPLPFVTRGVYEKLSEMKKMGDMDKAVTNLKTLLDKAFQAKWDELFKNQIHKRASRQQSLFVDNDNQKKLI